LCQYKLARQPRAQLLGHSALAGRRGCQRLADRRECGMSASARLPAAGSLNLISDDKLPESLPDEFAAHRDA
jgi:hypothetical protein